MATTAENGVHNFDSKFPIIATNLRALVSSWLPPAREPSPVDEENVSNGETQGRQERYWPLKFRRRVNFKIGFRCKALWVSTEHTIPKSNEP